MSGASAGPGDLTAVSFGREICGDLEPALRREWLVTNGLGGYASGTVAGINTRRYHGLLVAALQPPVARTVLASALQEVATYDGQRYPLSTHEYTDGTIDPQGYRYLDEFRLEGMLPVWRFEQGDAVLERRVCMCYGANTTYLVYHLARGIHSVELSVTPLVTYRDFHSLRSGQGWQPLVESAPHGARIVAGETPYWLLASAGTFAANGEWWWNFAYREEAARGLDDRDDLYAPGTFTHTLAPGESWTLALTTEPDADLDGKAALAAASQRQADLLHRARAEDNSPLARQLVLAADQFLVARGSTSSDPNAASGRTVIAGYHWFNDWGRDTMIALPGLTLATGRSDEAADILRTFARYLADGLLPNNFPDTSGMPPAYNTADATLWYVVAIYRYAGATGNTALVDELLLALRDIADWHLRGTRYNIGVAPDDGLLHAGEPGLQLTWMDAKVGDWVVTPRIGKPVEINALWYNVLRILEAFSRERGDAAGATNYGGMAERVRDAFRARFIRPDRPWLADVVDGPNGDDWSCRPNQLFALALPFPLLEGAEAVRVLDAVGSSLYTSFGLRSLAPDDPAYRGHYGGNQVERDGAYHQGTVWAWLIGPYAEAHYRLHHDAAAARALLAPFFHHLADAGLGSISEIFDGDPPHTPRGCIAQAWSVAEVLRVWRLLEHESTHPSSPANSAL